MTRTAISRGDKKSGSRDTWAKVKYDRQIVAIARVLQAPWYYFLTTKGSEQSLKRLGSPSSELLTFRCPLRLLSGNRNSRHGEESATSSSDFIEQPLWQEPDEEDDASGAR